MNVKPPDRNTAIIVGVGQYKEDVPQDLINQGLINKPELINDPVYMAAQAGLAALSDIDKRREAQANMAAQIDTIFCIRIFGDSGPLFSGPFGGSENMGAAIAARMGIEAERHIYGVIGGNTPQSLIADAAEEIEAGAAKAVLVCGGEAIANMKAAMRAGLKLDWSDDTDLSGAPLEDRGQLASKSPPLISRSAQEHELFRPIEYYGLIENARRDRQGLTREDYCISMSKIMSGLLRSSKANPLSAFSDIDEDLTSITAANPLFTDIYSKAILPKDSVNQGAAIIMTSYGRAVDMGLDPSRFIYLHAHVEGSEPPVLQRPELDKSPVLKACMAQALAAANITAQDIGPKDLYSCFPIVLKESAKFLGLNAYEDELTLTGGLAFFGGPGNNYSLHGIAELVQNLRNSLDDDYGLIHANGGFMSKHAIGIYSRKPAAFPARIMRYMAEGGPLLGIADTAQGTGIIDTFCVNYKKDVPISAIIIGHLKETGDRFYAKPKTEHKQALLDWLIEADPFGQEVQITTEGAVNYFTR